MSRTLVEALHLLAGLLVAVGLTWACAWAYPLGADVIWWCGGAAMLATALMGIGPLRRAWRADRAER